MAEDEAPKPAEPEASQSASPTPETAAEVETAEPEPPAAPLKVEPAAPPAPPNKLHEWGAALAIMVFLGFVLWVFLNFFRSATL